MKSPPNRVVGFVISTAGSRRFHRWGGLTNWVEADLNSDWRFEETMHMSSHSRLRVLFVIGSMGGGGAERLEVLANPWKRLDRSRFDLVLYLANKQGELLAEVPADVPIFAFWDGLPETPLRKVLRWMKLTRLLRQVRLARVLHEQRIDVIYDRDTLSRHTRCGRRLLASGTDPENFVLRCRSGTGAGIACPLVDLDGMVVRSPGLPCRKHCPRKLGRPAPTSAGLLSTESLAHSRRFTTCLPTFEIRTRQWTVVKSKRVDC